MIKNIFEVNNEEKNRILNLHESATKRQYLSEDENTSTTTMTTWPWDSKTKQVQGGGNPNYASFFVGLVDNNVQGIDEVIKNNRRLVRLKDEVNRLVTNRSMIDNSILNELQKELSKDIEVVKKLVDIAKKLGVNPENYEIYI